MIERIEGNDPFILQELIALDAQAFGAGGMSEWQLMPLIRHGQVHSIRREAKIAGAVQYMRDWHRPHMAYMVGLAVEESWRGQGIATELLQGSFSLLRQQGMQSVELTVAPSNLVARKLYEDKLGFVSTGYSENEFGAGEHRIILSLML